MAEHETNRQGEAELVRMLDLLAEQVARYRVDDLHLVYCNRAWAMQFRAEPKDLIGTPIDQYLNEAELAGMHAQLARLSPQTPHLRDTEARPASRTPHHWTEWADTYLPLPGGAEILAVGRDVTERHLAEQRLASSESMFRTLAEASPDLVWRLDTLRQARITYLSPSVQTLTGWPREALLGGIGRLSSVLDDDGRRLLQDAVETGNIPERFDARMRRRDDTWIVLDMQVSTLPDGFQGVGRDVTEVRQVQGDLATMALHDPLTGLGNRRMLDVLLPGALEHARQTGVPVLMSYLDLDDFKAVNDEHGHAAGDAVLQQAATRLIEAVRDADTLVRLGGDEFVVLHEPGTTDANTIAKRLSQTLAAPYELPGVGTVDCPASVGVAASTPTSTAEGLLREADQAMYAAKQAGRAEQNEDG
jgi:diguanylate cyclase (GGDEF)-like protein/PAS domain S-box-containing protein